MESGLAPAHDLALNLVLTLSHNWWVLLLRGCAAILFGGLAFATPGRSLESLVLLFGAFCLADGVMAAWTSIWHRRQAENGWLLLIGGLLGIGVGLMTIFQPAVTALGLLLYVAVWAVSTEWLSAGTAAAGLAQINAISNLAGFGTTYAVGFIKDATGSFALALLPMVGLSAMAALAIVWIGRNPSLAVGADKAAVTPANA